MSDVHRLYSSGEGVNAVYRKTKLSSQKPVVRKARPRTASGIGSRRARLSDAPRPPRMNGWSFDTKVDVNLIGRENPRQERRKAHIHSNTNDSSSSFHRRQDFSSSYSSAAVTRAARKRPSSSVGVRRKVGHRVPDPSLSTHSARGFQNKYQELSALAVDRMAAVARYAPSSSSSSSSSRDVAFKSITVSARPSGAIALDMSKRDVRAAIVTPNRAASVSAVSPGSGHPSVAPLRLENVPLTLDSDSEEVILDDDDDDEDDDLDAGAFASIYQAYKRENWAPVVVEQEKAVEPTPAPVRVELVNKTAQDDQNRRELYAKFLASRGATISAVRNMSSSSQTIVSGAEATSGRGKSTLYDVLVPAEGGEKIYTWNPHRAVAAKSARTFSGRPSTGRDGKSAASRVSSSNVALERRKIPRATSAIPGRRLARDVGPKAALVVGNATGMTVSTKKHSLSIHEKGRVTRARPKTAGIPAVRKKIARQAGIHRQSSARTRSSPPKTAADMRDVKENVQKAFNRASARRSSLDQTDLQARIRQFMSSVQKKSDLSSRAPAKRVRPKTSHLPRRRTPARRSSLDEHIAKYSGMLGLSQRAPVAAFAKTERKLASSSDEDDINYRRMKPALRGDSFQTVATCGFFIWLGEGALVRVFDFLDLRSQLAFSCINSYWHKFISKQPFWHHADFSSVGVNVKRESLASFVGAYNLDRLAHLSLSCCDHLASSDVEDFLTLLPPLRSLRVSRIPKLEDSALAFIGATCPKATMLDLSQCPKITDKGALEIASNCVELKRLKLSRLRALTESTYTIIGKNLHQLTHLDLTWCKALRDSSLEAIANGCCLLEHLNLRRCMQITDEGVEVVISTCKNLRVLALDHCSEVTDSACRFIATKGLAMEVISFVFCSNITDVGVSYLTRGLCRSLQYIFLDYCHMVSPACFELLRERTEHRREYEFGPSALQMVTHRICTHRGSDRMKHDLSEAECMGSPSLLHCNWN